MKLSPSGSRFQTISIALVGILVSATAIVTVGVTASSASTVPPWEPDANSVGALTFYNASGDVVTGGSLTDQPIAAFVEGTGTPRAGDTKATLYAYTPVSGEAPGQWSGEQLSASTVYPVSSPPSAALDTTLPVQTGGDQDTTLADYILSYPNSDTSGDGYAGLYVLRLKTSTPGKSVTTTYDAADIVVSGSTWSVVYPSTPTTETLAIAPVSPQSYLTSETLTATLTPSSATGTVQFAANGSDIGSPVAVSNGTASDVTTALAPGSDTVQAVFTPTAGSEFSGANATAPFTVNDITTSTSLGVVPAGPQQAGTSETITATITPTAATGTVQFEENSTDIGSPVAVSAGTASYITTTLPVGTDPLEADFTPTADNGYGASNGSTSITINGISTSTSLAVLPTGPQPYGTSETITATITPTAATGTVQFEENSTDIGSPVAVSAGTASYVTTTLPVGTDPLEAEFTGSGVYANSNGSTSLTINGISTSTSLAVLPAGPQPYGTSETITATITPSAATGTVQFEENSTDIGSPVAVSGGTANYVTTTLPVGTDPLESVFTATGNYAGSNGSTSLTVNPITTTTALGESPASPQVVGTSETITATVTPASATGTVQFEEDNADIGGPVNVSSGSASYVTTSLPIGSDPLEAVFTASGNFASSNGSSVFTVSPNPTTTSLAVLPAGPQPVDTSETLTATVSPTAATGTVQFQANGSNIGSPVAVSSGTAAYSTTALPAGADTLTAVFLPTAGNTYGGSTGSAALTVVPSKQANRMKPVTYLTRAMEY